MSNIKYLLSKILRKSLVIPAVKDSTIDKTSRVCSGSQVIFSGLGRYSYIGNSCSVVYTEIGNFCSIADYCIIGGASHPMGWVSTSPVFHKGKNTMQKNFATHEFEPFSSTKIGNDVWIGSNCIIKAGIRIGDGAVIGMGSVVTKDVEPYSIVGGNPAKLIRKRFDDVTIDKLLASKWWELTDEELNNMSKYFNNIDKFIENLGER